MAPPGGKHPNVDDLYLTLLRDSKRLASKVFLPQKLKNQQNLFELFVLLCG
jgi:hypothetical protein